MFYPKVISVGSLRDCGLAAKSVKYAAMPLCRGGRSEATRAVVNDCPVDSQSREWTEPQRDPRPPVSRHRRRASLVQREVVEEATADETGGIVIR